MTRFARARGSKACNERQEEEATPWHVMRQQLAEQLMNHQAQNESEKQSYNLKEILNSGAETQKEEVWSDFGEAKNGLKNQLKPNKEKYNNGNHIIQKRKINNNQTVETKDSIETNVIPNKKVKVVKTSKASEEYSSKEKQIKKEASATPIIGESKQKHLNKSVGSKGVIFNVESVKPSSVKQLTKHESGQIKDESNLSKNHAYNNNGKRYFQSRKSGISAQINKKSRGKNIFVETLIEQKDNSASFSSLNDESTSKVNDVKATTDYGNPITVKQKKKKIKTEDKPQNTENNLDGLQKPIETTTNMHSNFSNRELSSEEKESGLLQSGMTKNPYYMKNNPKLSTDNHKFYNNQRQEKGFARYPHEKRPQIIIANGREIHVIKYQGFLVKKEDADELKKLRKKLSAQGIPKEKLETIIKLERRKAEKALAREKKNVCFHCRQFGHNFSDCPEIKDSDMIKTGVCFKCGSLEHSHFECKVFQQQEFRHAVCFVCREQGHIARQCPLNTQGLYPKGGSCHLCGEVTHLRKDCPKAVEEKPNKSVTIDTLTNNAVEDIGSGMSHSQQRGTDSNKKKVIKFK